MIQSKYFPVVIAFLFPLSPLAAEKAQDKSKSVPAATEVAPPSTTVVKVPPTSQAEPGAAASTGEDWKGRPDPRGFDAGVLFGLGIIDTSSGFAVMGSVSRRILAEGFIPDVADVVQLEGQAGVVMVNPNTAFAYSAHLRWDFFKDSSTSFYALAGFGGNVVDVGGGTRFALHPRLGIGGMWTIASPLKLRAEFSHELVGVGVAFAF